VEQTHRRPARWFARYYHQKNLKGMKIPIRSTPTIAFSMSRLWGKSRSKIGRISGWGVGCGGGGEGMPFLCPAKMECRLADTISDGPEHDEVCSFLMLGVAKFMTSPNPEMPIATCFEMVQYRTASTPSTTSKAPRWWAMRKGVVDVFEGGSW